MRLLLQVSLGKALFTRITGPGMVHPKVTSALKIDAIESKPKGRRANAVHVCAGSTTEATFDPSYPWEKRALTWLDFYAGEEQYQVAASRLTEVANTPICFCSCSILPGCESMSVISQANGRPKVSVCFSVTRVQSVCFSSWPSLLHVPPLAVQLKLYLVVCF